MFSLRQLRLFSSYICLAALITCTRSRPVAVQHEAVDIETVQERGVLRVATRYFATSYYYAKDNEAQGIEHDLITDFAQAHGIDVDWELGGSLRDVLQALRSGQIDIAAAALTRTQERDVGFLSSRSYFEFQEIMVCHKDLEVKSLADLEGHQIHIERDSSYEESLSQLQERLELQVSVISETSSEEFLAQIDEGQVACTIIDEPIFKIFRKFYPNVEKKLTLPETRHLVWLFHPSREELIPVVNQWIQHMRDSRRLSYVLDKYFLIPGNYDSYDVNVFRERIKTRLPEYIGYFRKAATEQRFDWRLLAALSYQESQWDPEAISPTGVRGLMMLTQSTAESLGVTDRSDPKQSILGGAAYLRSRVARLPTHILEDEQIFFALAAYNVGFAHLTDARALAVYLGSNPNRWRDVRAMLPKLSHDRYRRFLRYGYARGIEPVVFVQRIQSYYELLQKEFPQ